MPYGELCEGDRVFTAVAGPAASADINEIQDQVKTMLGPHWQSILRYGQIRYNATAVATPYWDWSNLWWDLGATGECQLQIPIHSGQKLTDIKLTLYHSAGDSAGGTSILYSQSTIPVAGAMAARTSKLDLGDIWNAGGATTYYEHTETGLALVAGDNEDWYLSFIGLGAQSTYIVCADVKIEYAT
jgi:hypothetical protein